MSLNYDAIFSLSVFGKKFRCRQYIFTLFLIIPLGKGHTPSFEEIKPILHAEHVLFTYYTVACTL